MRENLKLKSSHSRFQYLEIEMIDVFKKIHGILKGMRLIMVRAIFLCLLVGHNRNRRRLDIVNGIVVEVTGYWVRGCCRGGVANHNLLWWWLLLLLPSYSVNFLVQHLLDDLMLLLSFRFLRVDNGGDRR